MLIVAQLERSQFCRDHGTPAFVEMPAHQIPAEDVPQRVGADKRLAVAAQHFFIGKADLDQGAISVPAIENLALVQHELVREPVDFDIVDQRIELGALDRWKNVGTAGGLVSAGIDIALGCDNYSCAETQNIFTAMRMLCLLPAVTDPDPGPINAGYALKAATLSGARAVGLGKKVGALKPGMAADLMILDLNEPAFVPFNSAARQIVFAESGRAVETVFVDGRPVVRGGKLVTLDEAKLAAEAAELAPAFRRDAADLAARNADLTAPLLDANRAAWKVPLGIERYIGRTKI
jgi:hypothetical protein